jgi:beta-fructofuranosidase
MNYLQIQQQANECFQNYLYSDSIAFYERCIEINPAELSNYWYLGLASLLAEDELLTETVWLSVFLEASEEEADLWTKDLVAIAEQLALKSLKAKRRSDAEIIYLKIQDIAPDHVNACLGLSQVHLENGKYREAIDALNQFIELEPDLATAHHNLGICFQQLQDFNEAINNFNQAIALKSDYISAYYSLGICLIAKGEYEQAIVNFQSVIKLAPQHLNAHIYLGDCFHKTTKVNAAIECFEKARKIKPDSALVLSGIAICLIAKGELEKAQTLLYKALELAPKLPVIYYNLGYCYRNMGKLDQAIGYFNKAIDLKPDWLDAKLFIKNIEKSVSYCPKVKQGYNVWDAMLFKDEDCYRLMYLQGNSRAYPHWIVGEMAMAVSTDLEIWKDHNLVIKTDANSDWEDGRILAGSLYKENGRYYLFYSASPSKNPLEERIGLATSIDCVTWKKGSKPFLEQDERFYGSYPCFFNEKPNKQTPWRDPYVVKDRDTGKYCMFITTSFREGGFPYKGCIGLAISDHIDGDYEILPPVVLPLLEGTQESIFVEMERPQIIYRNGQYNLFCSANIININPKWIAKVGKDKITSSSLYWFVSDNIMGSYKPVSEKPIVKGSDRTGLYATNIIEAPDGKLFAVGCEGVSKTLEVSCYYPVIWKGNYLEIMVDRE